MPFDDPLFGLRGKTGRDESVRLLGIRGVSLCRHKFIPSFPIGDVCRNDYAYPMLLRGSKNAVAMRLILGEVFGEFRTLQVKNDICFVRKLLMG